MLKRLVHVIFDHITTLGLLFAFVRV